MGMQLLTAFSRFSWRSLTVEANSCAKKNMGGFLFLLFVMQIFRTQSVEPRAKAKRGEHGNEQNTRSTGPSCWVMHG
jgi:hypothetical protein